MQNGKLAELTKKFETLSVRVDGLLDENAEEKERRSRCKETLENALKELDVKFLELAKNVEAFEVKADHAYDEQFEAIARKLEMFAVKLKGGSSEEAWERKKTKPEQRREDKLEFVLKLLDEKFEKLAKNVEELEVKFDGVYGGMLAPRPVKDTKREGRDSPWQPKSG
eukprot:TRINITY_DN26172_c0_g1_i3.p1 TRINITY_DN26172_c0_g1~~TRINITY_DN26172_c0_g1_i3.p1  ORF type:complete len:168 (-),score=61.22 TRINITY_DN26172_c0_g1_i3:138-641(-)